MEISKLHFYSIGLVAANKPLSKKEIEVTCIEDHPMLSGELSDNIVKTSTKGTDADGASYQTEVKTTASIQATWLPIGSSNRITAPDVRRGETVVIYRFADSDQYWWSTLKDDSKLRKLETVIYAFSATQKEGAPVDSDNYYFLEISTHKKIIHFSTSKVNGEYCCYDVQINTQDGFIMITDDIGNYIGLDSANHQIEMKNKEGSLIEVNKNNINHICTGTITQQAENIVQKCTTHTLDATTSTITATSTHNGQTTHNGNFILAGNFSMGGAGGGAAVATINGSVNMAGGLVNIEQNLTVGGISFLGHKHSDPQGGDVSPPHN